MRLSHIVVVDAAKAGVIGDDITPDTARIRSMKQEMTALLADWCEGLLRHQINAPADPERHGALICPDCGFLHGRCADAVYPFIRMARATGEDRWIQVAVAVQRWSHTVSHENGSFRNDVSGNNWDGITVFAVLALAEALHEHGDLLPDATRSRWMERLERAARWINGVDWADHGTINYPISAAAALAAASRVLGDGMLLDTARHWGTWARDYFLPGGILFGEGPRVPTKRGIYAVDALYNLEESLPNYALYAEITGDAEARALILRSFASHLDFLLPDGSYDAGWCSRSFKWTLWGSRTSDGIAGLLPYTRFDDRIAEAVWRNIEYLHSCTHDGLLYGGPHLQSHGRPPCIHHTFAHAKALAAALDGGHFADKRRDLPADKPRGIRTRPALGTTFVSHGDWRASFTVSDVFYGARGSHASGGAMTMLWHAATGPLCVSSMSQYDRIEGRNMATMRSETEIAVLTPRLEHGTFSGALDWNATLQAGEDSVAASGRLTDLQGEPAGEFLLETRFEKDTVHFHARGEGAVFVLPVVSRGGERVEWSAHRVEIHKPHASVICESTGIIRGDANRIFHFVPGVQAVRLEINVPAGGLDVFLQVRR
ncbi:MAG: hypothetical protein H7145_24345 [Akkermansiaceae bacterium]|nr:hypothetical protein [Armatimonadota bacterium]